MTHLARWCYGHAALVLVLWIVAVAVLVGITKKVGRDFSDGFSLPGTDSTTAQQLLASAVHRPGSGDDSIVFHATGEPVTAPSIAGPAARVLGEIGASRPVTGVGSPFAPGAGAQISADRHTAYATVNFARPDQSLTKTDITRVVDEASALRSTKLEVEFGGGAFQTLKGNPVSGSVGIGLVAAAIVLLLAFGSLLSMVIPLLAAVVSVASGIEIVGLLSHVLSINSITPSIAALIGTGVAVDYALFVVTRHRNGLRAGLSPEAAAITALATSGRAVVFAGSTVVVAMLGLLTLGVSFLSGVGIAAAITVAVAVAAATTLLPAVFRLMGLRVLGRRDRRRLAAGFVDADDSRSGPWARWAALVQRRPLWLSAGALTVMVVLLLPAFAIRLGSSDQGNDPASSTTRKAYDLLSAGFGAGHNGPLILAAQAGDPGAQSAFVTLQPDLRALPDVASVQVLPPDSASTVRVLDVVPRTSPQSAQTRDLIADLRDQVIPSVEHGTTLRVYVGGQTAVFQDFANVLAGKLPIFLAVIVLLGGVLLMLAFRSVVIALTAALMNVLAAGASFGVVVAVFQWGWGSDALGLGKAGPIEAFLPVMLIAILFGLSMDYQVFLVSRIHEEWLRTRDNARSIRIGQATTGRVITAAAAIMVFVFLAFVLERRRPIGEFGLGLAVAILLDALVLRTVLVPAAMQLLGRVNWWLPRRLDRVLPHVSFEPAEPDRVDERVAG